MAIDLRAQKKVIDKKAAASQSKTLTVGTQELMINGISCVLNNYNDQDGYDIKLSVEGPDLGEGFEGFFIDKEEPALGRYKGAVGTVKIQQYTFATKTFPATAVKEEQTVERDASVLLSIGNLAKICGKYDELMDAVVDDIPSFVARASEVLAGSKIRATVGGKEYLDKGGYVKHDMYIVRADKGFFAYEALDAATSKIQPFVPGKHIIGKKQTATAAVDNFEPVEVEFDATFEV